MSRFFGVIDISDGTRQIVDIGSGGLSGVLIGNESGLTVVITLQGANTSKSLYPGVVDWFPIPQGSNFNGNVQIDPSANLNNVASWPGSYVQIDTFGPNEIPTGTYPIALSRNTNVGNTITVNQNTTLGPPAQLLQNDGNISGTQFIEATVGGDSSSAVNVTNDGTWILGNATHFGSISSDNGTIVSDGSGNLTATLVTSSTFTNQISLLVGGTYKKSNNKIGSFSVISSFTSNGANQTIAHNFGRTPLSILLYATNVVPQYEIISISSSTFVVNAVSNGHYVGIALG